MAQSILDYAGLRNVEQEKRRNVKAERLRPMVTIACRCEKCGQIFARSHPKDPQVLCEKCRG